MKKSLLLAASLLVISGLAQAESVTLGANEHQLNRLIEREIGPGTTYLRLRLPEYPLNANVLIVDLTNPYNRIETTVAKESSRGTEGLVTAAQRQSSVGHRPIAAANANFWVVGSHPEGPIWTGITRNVSLRNGKLITESNQHRDLWDGGTMRTGIVGISYDKSMYIDYCTSSISISNDKIGMFVYGDFNHHPVYIGVTAGTDVKWLKVTDLDFVGWRYFTVDLSELDSSFSYMLWGFKMDQIDSPMCTKGAFYIDNLAASSLSGIDDITADAPDAPASFYNLQGIEVDAPGPGIYIEKRGGVARKIEVK